MSEKYTAHIINHTHWDREWRYPIWQTRFMLVDFIDELIELMESEKYESFLMDGQVIPILDYLDIRPEKKDVIKSLIKSGKLEIGPWYVLPDEFPVDGEALVRNLLWGIKKASQLGKALMVGYTPFGWGQTSQLAQIYKGFGIDTAFIGKKVSKERAPKTEFIWRSPDGSELLTSRFGDLGRQNFYFVVHLSSLFGIDHLGSEWYSKWEQEDTLFHRADNQQYEQDYFRLDQPKKFHSEIITSEMAQTVWTTTDESVIEADRLMMNGCDYAAAQPLLPEMIKKLQQVDKNEQRLWKQNTLTAFSEILKDKVKKDELAVVEGELRDGPAAYVTGNALMTRNYIKFLNKKAQNMLIRFAEPLSTLCSLYDFEYPSVMLEKAWENLLQAHPHDSINAVTQDETADDVQARLKTVIQLSQAIGNRAIQNLVKMADLSSFNNDDILLLVVNPLPYQRKEILDAWIDIPVEPEKYPQMLPQPEGLSITDAQGKAVATQWKGSLDKKISIHENHTRAFPLNVKRYNVLFDTGPIPACGYKVFKVDRNNSSSKTEIQWSDQWAKTSDILKAPNIIENDYLRVEVNPNGTFDLVDKENNQKFTNLNYFQDHGDCGNYWSYENFANDQWHNTLGANARIWVENSGAISASIVTEVTMDLPADGDYANRRRSSCLKPLTIVSKLTLKAASKQIDIEIEFDNKHKDHCLRVMLPTAITEPEQVNAADHFNVQSRSIRPQGPDSRAAWPEMARLPFENFVDISDGKRGLAVLNNCLTEYEVSDNDERILALTLLRSVKNSICTELRVWSDYPNQDGGQCLGKHKVTFALMPHSGNWQNAEIDVLAQLYNSELRIVQTNKSSGSIQDHSKSFFEISNRKLRFSCLKKAEDSNSVVLRVYNPTQVNQSSSLNFSKPIKKAWVTDLNEQRKNELTIKDGSAKIKLPAKKILTFELIF